MIQEAEKMMYNGRHSVVKTTLANKYDRWLPMLL